jgi:predicted kinase
MASVYGGLVITVISGAPGSGKTTYVDERAMSGDVIVDMDKLAAALTTPDIGSHDYSDLVRQVAFHARQAAVKEALKLGQSNRSINIWIVHTDPGPDLIAMYKVLGGKIVWLDPGQEVCIDRVRQRSDRAAKIGERVIREYYGKRPRRIDDAPDRGKSGASI